MSALPWQPEAFDLPDEPSDADLRRAFRILLSGGSVGGATIWSIACARALNALGPDPDSDPAGAGYERALRLAPPTRRTAGAGVLGRAGRRGRNHTALSGRVGDVVPPNASDDEIRRMYGAGDAEAIISFRRQLEEMNGE